MHLLRKADRESFKTHLKDFCNSFVLSYDDKPNNNLWLEVKGDLNAEIAKFIPSKFVGQKIQLP